MSARHPLVSVVLPTRNRAGRVGRAIESVLRQSLRELELIAVDDGSEDETAHVLAEYAAADDRVRPVRREAPGGAPAARNRGVALARGEYVAFLDDDAVWVPAKLERQLALFRKPVPPGAVYSSFVHYDALGRGRVVGSAAAQGDARRALLRSNFIDTSTLVVRRELLERIGGFDERLPRLQDWDLCLRLAEVTTFAYCPEPLVHSHFSPGGISTRGDALQMACRILWEKLEHRPGVDRAALADLGYALGHVLMIGGAPVDGRSFLSRSLRLRPWPPRRMVMTAAATLGARPYGALASLHASLVKRRTPAAAGIGGA